MTMKRSDGGSAYPTMPLVPNGLHGEEYQLNEGQEGMSLRDYFAAKALQGILSTFHGQVVASDVSRSAYAMADAMLKERERK